MLLERLCASGYLTGWSGHLSKMHIARAVPQRPTQPPTGGGLSWWLLPLRGGHGRGLRRFAAVMAEVFGPSWWSRRRSFLHRHKNNAKIASHATSAFFITGTCLGFAPLRGTCAARRIFRRNHRKKEEKSRKKPPPLAVGGGHVAVFAAPPWRSRRSFADTAGGYGRRSFLVFQFGG